jgi:ATP-binding cassette subfamily B protein RaxB
MAMVASFHDHKLDKPSMRKRLNAIFKRINLQQPIELAISLGLASPALQRPIDEV